MSEEKQRTEVEELRRQIAELTADCKLKESALRLSDALFSDLVANVDDVIFLISVEAEDCCRLILVNKRFLEMTGLSESQVLGKQVQEVIPAASHSLILGKCQESIRTGQTARWQETSKYQTGNWTREVTIVPVIGSGGQCVRLMGTVHDITERKLAEDALTKSEYQYRSLFNHMSNGFAYCRMIYGQDNLPEDFVYLEVNPAFEPITGLSRDAVIGKRFSEAFPGSISQNVELLNIYGEVAQNGIPQHIEKYFQPLKLWFSINVYSPQKEYFVAVFENITERKMAAAVLQESEEKYRLLHENAGIGIGYYKLDGTVISYNKLAASHLNGVPQDFIGKSLYELFSKEEAVFYHNRIKAVAKSESPKVYEDLVALPTENKYFLSTFSCVRDSKHDILGIQIISQDITKRKKAEQTLQLQTATLAALNEIIFKANQADDLGELLGSVLDESLRLLDFDAGGVYLVNRATRTAEVVHSRNLDAEFLAAKKTVSIDAKPYDTLFIKNEPIITENYAQISPVHSKKSGFQSIVSIPLISKGVAIGALNLASTRRVIITQEEKETLFSICRELGSTIGRMTAEEETRKASRNLETLFNSIDEMVFVMDMQVRIITVNNTVQKRLLYKPEELIGVDLLQLHPAERRDEAFQKVQGIIAGTIDTCQVPVLTRDGTIIEVETKVTRGFWNGQEVLIGVTRDTTVRKKAEEALIESEEKFRKYVENTFDVIFTVDLQGIFLFASPAWERHFGYPASQVIGQSFTLFVHPDDTAALNEYLQIISATRQAQTSPRFRVKHADGSWRWFEVNGSVFSNRGTLQYLGSGRDITAQLGIEVELKALYKTEKDQRHQLEQEAATRIRFIDELAHELKGPLTPLLVSSGMLKEVFSQDAGSIQYKLVENINRGTELLISRLDELLDVARFARGSNILNIQAADTRKFIEKVVSDYTPVLTKNSQQVITEIDEDLPAASFDHSRLEQVIINLLTNASKYSLPGSRIWVTAAGRENGIMIAVKDEGIGISAEDQSRLFQPYQRVGSGQSMTQGLGLGLTIVKSIIEAHGGKIWVESVLGKGSTFRFWLPLTGKPNRQYEKS